jgi:hypothetical protein
LIDLINIIAVTIFGVEHRFDDGFTYGQAFWVTVCSTIASFLTNISLIYDLRITSDFENAGKIPPLSHRLPHSNLPYSYLQAAVLRENNARSS